MSYTGEYKDGLRDGFGTYVFPGGLFTYKGEWKRGKMHGKGVYTICDGGTYEGEFIDGEIEGAGLRRWPDGSTFNGQFRHGVRQGEGVMIASNGEVYEGHWEENQRCGLGELRKSNKDVYRGDFYRHYPHGNGRIKFAHDGSIYDGDWVNGEICGRGVLKDARDLVLYDGEWLKGMRHGNGVGFLSSTESTQGRITFDGVWANDKPLAPTTKLVFKIVIPATSQTNEAEASIREPVYCDLPAQIVVEKKQTSRLPPLAVVCLHESPITGDLLPVTGETGRQLRLRIFEVSTQPAIARVGSQSDLSTVASEVEEPSQWRFAVFDENATKAEANVDATPEGTEGAPNEVFMEEVIVTNRSGVAVFTGLQLPSASLLEAYELVCESVNGGDHFDPLKLPIQLVE